MQEVYFTSGTDQGAMKFGLHSTSPDNGYPALAWRCRGKVEMSPSWQSRNVVFCLSWRGVHVILPVPVRRRREIPASNPVEEIAGRNSSADDDKGRGPPVAS